jgi:hypothetical protein
MIRIEEKLFAAFLRPSAANAVDRPGRSVSGPRALNNLEQARVLWKLCFFDGAR